MATALLTSIFGIAVLIAMVVPISLYYAWATTHLWTWFMVPFGLPPLTILQAWGISLTLGTIRPKIFSQKVEIDWSNTIVAIIIGPPLTLGFGYAIKFWWM